MIVEFALVAAIAIQEYPEEVGDPNGTYPEFTSSSGPFPFDDQAAYAPDPNAPEPDPLYTIRPGTPGVHSNPSGGNVTYTLTGPARITVRVPFVGRYTATLGAGSSFRGRDANNNNIPDVLERPEIDIGPL